MSSLPFDRLVSHKLILIEVFLSGERLLHMTASDGTFELIKQVAANVWKREHPREFEILKDNPNAQLNIEVSPRDFASFVERMNNMAVDLKTKVKGRVLDSSNNECLSIINVLCEAYGLATFTQIKRILEFKVTSKVKAYECAKCGKRYDGDDYKNNNKRMLKCAGCTTRKTFYCNKECQRAHWKSTHKMECDSRKQ